MDLVVDCSRKGINLGVYAQCAPICEICEPNAKGEEIDALFSKLLAENSIEMPQIKRVLTTLGPGSFTGIRAGIAFCEGLCFSGRRSLHGISTLKALALSYSGKIILHARANLYYSISERGEETLEQFETPPQTSELLPITPFAKLIDSIPPSRVQKANYLINPYGKSL
jgi:tRNA threonylcarbamoyladenosine biosynthesis protein TsaB